MPAQPATNAAALTINTIRGLAIDAVQTANSGHPGMPLGCAAMGYALFARHLRYDPEAPQWFNRDRFLLSAGHGSMLLYSLLYLTGYDLSLDDIKRFRQWGSRTPGHPENGLTPGVEMATGPLGQGFATGVGMAIAEEKLRHEFPGVVDHRVYAICSDGDLMEGVSHEAASLAGHLGLERLIYLYDSNRTTIDGSTDLSYSEDVRGRFEAYGWHVDECDGLDLEAVDAAITRAKSTPGQPHLIICRTVIGYGSPNMAGTARTHGAALGDPEVAATKSALGMDPGLHFAVPEEAVCHMREVGARHRAERMESERLLAATPELKRRIHGGPTKGWQSVIPTFDEPIATRAASNRVLNALAPSLPELTGGSADLAESNGTLLHDSVYFSRGERRGRNIAFGVREHAMACAVNGMNLAGGLRAYGGTFLIFSDYMRPAIRLSALMECPSVFVFTHDSIGLGEDGPTHQPIEHLMSLRAIPHLDVWRPADGNETAAAWEAILQKPSGPSAIVLTRQKVAALTPPGRREALRGGYVLDCPGDPQTILIGTGSELEICVAAGKLLAERRIRARVVSLPCWELFSSQSTEYRDEVLPASVTARVSVEAGATLGWERWIGPNGTAVGLDHFGASAPYQTLYREFGITAERVARLAESLVVR